MRPADFAGRGRDRALAAAQGCAVGQSPRRPRSAGDKIKGSVLLNKIKGSVLLKVKRKTLCEKYVQLFPRLMTLLIRRNVIDVGL